MPPPLSPSKAPTPKYNSIDTSITSRPLLPPLKYLKASFTIFTDLIQSNGISLSAIDGLVSKLGNTDLSKMRSLGLPALLKVKGQTTFRFEGLTPWPEVA